MLENDSLKNFNIYSELGASVLCGTKHNIEIINLPNISLLINFEFYSINCNVYFNFPSVYVKDKSSLFFVIKIKYEHTTQPSHKFVIKHFEKYAGCMP